MFAISQIWPPDNGSFANAISYWCSSPTIQIPTHNSSQSKTNRAASSHLLQPIQMVQQMYSIQYTTLVVDLTPNFLALTSVFTTTRIEASATTHHIYVFNPSGTPKQSKSRRNWTNLGHAIPKPKQLMCLAQTHGRCQTDVAVLILESTSGTAVKCVGGGAP